MSAMMDQLDQLVGIRSQLTGEVLAYLAKLQEKAGRLALKPWHASSSSFHDLYQPVRLSLGEPRRAIIVAPGGYGKTWFLCHEAHVQATQAIEALRNHTTRPAELCLPILLPFAELQAPGDDLADQFIKRLGELQPSARFLAWARQKLDRRQCLLLLDAWDEAPAPRAAIGKWLVEYAGAAPQSAMILTARDDYDLGLLPRLPEMRIDRFKWPQITALASHLLGEAAADAFLADLGRDGAARALASIPLMLTLMCRVHAADSSTLPTRRAELLERCFRDLLRDRQEDKEQLPTLALDRRLTRRLDRLAAAALPLLEARQRQFTADELAEALAFGAHEEREEEAFLATLQRGRVVIYVGEGGDESRWTFLHPLVHEFLAARGLVARLKAKADSESVRKLFARYAPDRGWRELFLLAAELMEDSGALLARLRDTLRHLAADDASIPLITQWAEERARAASHDAAAAPFLRSYYVLLLAATVIPDAAVWRAALPLVGAQNPSVARMTQQVFVLANQFSEMTQALKELEALDPPIARDLCLFRLLKAVAGPERDLRWPEWKLVYKFLDCLTAAGRGWPLSTDQGGNQMRDSLRGLLRQTFELDPLLDSLAAAPPALLTDYLEVSTLYLDCLKAAQNAGALTDQAYRQQISTLLRPL